ncbi:hypothetical protein GCM10009415_19760 [Chitinophaga japonensis]
MFKDMQLDELTQAKELLQSSLLKGDLSTIQPLVYLADEKIIESLIATFQKFQSGIFNPRALTKFSLAKDLWSLTNDPIYLKVFEEDLFLKFTAERLQIIDYIKNLPDRELARQKLLVFAERDEDEYVRAEAAKALFRINSLDSEIDLKQEPYQHIIKGLMSEDAILQKKAFKELQQILT